MAFRGKLCTCYDDDDDDEEEDDDGEDEDNACVRSERARNPLQKKNKKKATGHLRRGEEKMHTVATATCEYSRATRSKKSHFSCACGAAGLRYTNTMIHEVCGVC